MNFRIFCSDFVVFSMCWLFISVIVRLVCIRFGLISFSLDQTGQSPKGTAGHRQVTMAVCQAITPRWNGSRIGGKDLETWWCSGVRFLLLGFWQQDSKSSTIMNHLKKSPTGPTERTPKPEYLTTLATDLGVHW